MSYSSFTCLDTVFFFFLLLYLYLFAFMTFYTSEKCADSLFHNVIEKGKCKAKNPRFNAILGIWLWGLYFQEHRHMKVGWSHLPSQMSLLPIVLEAGSNQEFSVFVFVECVWKIPRLRLEPGTPGLVNRAPNHLSNQAASPV